MCACGVEACRPLLANHAYLGAFHVYRVNVRAMQAVRTMRVMAVLVWQYEL